MAEAVLSRPRWNRWHLAAVAVLALTLPTLSAAADRHRPDPLPTPPDLLLEGGRKLTFETAISAEEEVRKPGFWGKVFDVVAGEPMMHHMVRPYSIAVDSQGRMIVTDPGAAGVHVFDLAHHKYKFLERKDKNPDSMIEPQCVALDANDTIYVTDSQSGKIFVFSSEGKFLRVLASARGGEGYFKRPTGIAVDSAAQRIYIADTLRHKLFVLDMAGNVLESWGKHGGGNLEFNYPTELRMFGGDLLVVDAMNFRVQRLSKKGEFLNSFGRPTERIAEFFRPKAIAIDSERHYYIPDAMQNNVQVFDGEGQLLYSFGGSGTALGSFQLPAGISIDRNDRVYVVDSFNRRVQVFQYHALPPERKAQP